MAWTVKFAIFVIFCVQQLAVSQNTPPTKNKNCQGCQMGGCGMPGIPGANGIPGVPGSVGAPGYKGDHGSKGETGQKGGHGLQGVKGHRGVAGPEGTKGDRGSRGQNGAPGKTGPTGPTGPKGDQGNDGFKGDAGQKGDAAAAGPISAANWKQCVWKSDDGRDSGKIKECRFNKLQGSTALKVSFQGNMRSVYAQDARCTRWYFKFNGNECSGPMTIEAVVYSHFQIGKYTNLLHHRSFEGYCENLPRGAINVELWVGSCPSGSTQGDAHTGWNSVSRIMVEEVPRSQ